MKIRLVDKSEYGITRAEIVSGRFEIDFADKTAEEVEQICSIPANFAEIELLTDAGEIFSDGIKDWTVYGGTILRNGVKTAIMTKPVNVTEQRLTAAEANALTAKKVAENQAEDIEQLKKYAEEGELGADQAALAASLVVAKANSQALSDAQALEAKALYDTFDDLVKLGYTAEKQGFKFRDGDRLWKTAQDNVKFQAQYRPGQGTESLYTHIDEAHAGTQEDPIPAKTNMEYEYGKYYSEGDMIYICERGGVSNPEELYGQKIVLQYLPSALIGQYFRLVS